MPMVQDTRLSRLSTTLQWTTCSAGACSAGSTNDSTLQAAVNSLLASNFEMHTALPPTMVPNIVHVTVAHAG